MLSRIDDHISLECDCCADVTLCNHTMTTNALSEARSEGWKTSGEGDEMLHFCCKSCKEEVGK